MCLRQLFCIALIFCFAAPCYAQQRGVGIDGWFTADILKATLYAKTDEENKFCDYVIQKWNEGIIPFRLIYGVYQKAMTKDRGRRFVYFKVGLELMCKQEGIALLSTPTKTSKATLLRFPSLFKGVR